MLRLTFIGLIFVASTACAQEVVYGGGYGGGGYGAPQQAASRTHDLPKMEVRTYRVTDLVLEPKHYRFGDNGSPPPEASGGGMGGGIGGGMGGGMMGGGMYSVPDRIHLGQNDFGGDDFGELGGGYSAHKHRPTPHIGLGLRLSTDDLINIITSNIDVNSWSDVGGPGHISYGAGIFIVSQTAEAHRKIATLLDDLRKQGAAIHSMTIKAYWLPTNDIESILIDHRKVDPAKLRQSIQQAGAVAQISCFDSQTVHLFTGSERSVISSLIPVVGQASKNSAHQYARNSMPKHVLGQLDTANPQAKVANEFHGEVGYQPVTNTDMAGCFLQVCAATDVQKQTAIIDVHSSVVRPNKKGGQHDFHGVTKLDKVNNVTQQFKTTLRMPTNQPVLIGGSTVEPTHGKKEQANKQLYLILEIVPD